MLKKFFEVNKFAKNESYPNEKLKTIVEKYDAVLSNPTDKFTMEILQERNENLK